MFLEEVQGQQQEKAKGRATCEVDTYVQWQFTLNVAADSSGLAKDGWIIAADWSGRAKAGKVTAQVDSLEQLPPWSRNSIHCIVLEVRSFFFLGGRTALEGSAVRDWILRGCWQRSAPLAKRKKFRMCPVWQHH